MPGAGARPAHELGPWADEDVEEHLERLAGHIVEVGDPEIVPLASALAMAAFRRRSTIHRLGDDLGDLARLVVDAARVLAERGAGEVALHVSQPDEGGAVVDVNVDDGPFLVSTLSAELSRQGYEPHDLLHPILGVERNDDGTIRQIVPARHAAHRESWIHARLGERLGDEQREHLEQALVAVMRDVKRVTDDFPALQQRVRDMADEAQTDGARLVPSEEADEVSALLTWLLDDHVVLLGAADEVRVDGELQPDPDSGLGLLSDADTSTPAPPDLGERLLQVRRGPRRSSVHRNEPMLEIGLVRVDESGHVVGRRRLDGMLSQKAFTQPSSAIPVLREKLRRVLELEDVVDHSHDERALRDLFEAIPKPELLSVSVEELRRTLVDLLASAKRHSLRLVVTRHGGDVSALVTVPRERFDADLRRALQDLLEDAYGPRSVDYHLALTEGDQALLHFDLHAPTQPDVRLDRLQRAVVELARTWQDRLSEAMARAELDESSGVHDADRLMRRWEHRLPDSFTSTTEPVTAVGDVVMLDRLLADDEELLVRVVADGGGLRVALFKLGTGIELSSVLPMIESAGLIVIEEVPHRIDVRGLAGDAGDVHVHVVRVRGEHLDGLADDDAQRLSDSLMAIWRGDTEADSLNRLVLSAGLTWHDVDVLRAYRRYRRQVGTAFTEAYQNDALCDHPAVARALVDLFGARFDPDLDTVSTDRAAEDARQRVVAGLDDVTRLDQDRILRAYLGMIDATLRTNRYREPRRGWLSLKFDSRAIPGAPKPVPYREIFVWSPRMEAVHLRGGRVARGGLRWSDRLEDVRTEVLGLLKAQITKNAPIVPTGAKGGFVLKRPPEGGDALRAAVRRQYETFIRGLLDVTDDVVDDEVRPPARVRRRDGDDPYLVVAADRGTATFSDLANAISEEYGFWLGDAFASGGSSGYDHKEMAITARGAWVAVRRHFLELDVDVQSEPVRVVGIGDMSGDVFGNGMLCSRTIRLVAAFDHRDVFLDPDPDPEVSYRERERLAALPRSSWRDYDPDLISTGGGVWSRTVKSIPLSDEVRSLLGVDHRAMPPPELVKAVLRAPVDLLFAGGIGTFVRASAESDDEVGDRANDAIRITADEVGARVVGEGANLAFTQRGRIAYARRGGRINLDAIDNSAGVATSDAEVNLKVLLRSAIVEGELDRQGRDALLVQVRDDVAEAVLQQVWRQSWALSREQRSSPANLEAYDHLLVDLEEADRADREVDVLPSSDELRRRRELGAGLTRPELGVLLGGSKRDLTARLLKSDLPDDPALRPLLSESFPAAVVERFDHLLDRHRLRRELVASRLAGQIVDRMGITWVSRTAHERGCSAAEVAAGWWIAQTVLGAGRVWRRVDDLEDRVVPDLQLEMADEIVTVVDACARAYVRAMPVDSLGALIEADTEAFEALAQYLARLEGTQAAIKRARVTRWIDLGVDDDLAERLAQLADLTLAPDVANVARRLDRDVDVVADAFISVSDRLPLDDLHDRLVAVQPVDQWERWQVRSLVDELRDVRRHVAAAALATGATDGRATVQDWFAARSTAVDRVGVLLGRMDADPDAGIAAAAVVVAALRGLVD